MSLRKVFRYTWLAFVAGVSLWLETNKRDREWERKQKERRRARRLA